jgi:hypothetical protein
MYNFGINRITKPFRNAFVSFELFRLSFFPLLFVGGTVGSLYPSTTDCQTSNPCAYTYVFILLLQNAYL